MINFYFFLTVFCFAYSVGEPLCGPESCNDLMTVKACNNVKYCISDVWSNKIYSGSRDKVCDICLEMVKEARNQLESNETMSELKEVLEGSCKLLMVKTAVKICQKLADQFVPELVMILASQMDPEAVCSISRLCNNPELREEQIKSKECVTCQKFVTFAADFVERSPERVLTNQLANACRAMGSYSDSCMDSLLRDPRSLVDRTKNVLRNRPCELSRLCPEGSTPPIEKSLGEPPSGSGDESRKNFCSLCPALMAGLDGFRDREKPEAVTIDRTRKICKSLSVPESVCSDFVERRIMIDDYFRSGLSNDYVCTLGIGVCNDASEQVPIRPLLPVSKRPEKAREIGRVSIGSDRIFGIKIVGGDKPKRVQLPFGDPAPKPFRSLLPSNLMAGGNGNDCLACTDTFRTVSDYLFGHRDYVESILKESCRGTEDYGKCADFVEKYGKHLFAETAQFAPEKVCPGLVPFCDGKPLDGGFAAKLAMEETRNSNRSCKFCVDLFDSLKEVGSGAENQLNSVLRETCQKSPPEASKICHEMTANFLRNALNSVLAESSPVEACDRLKLCKPEKETTESNDKMDADHCANCLLVVRIIYDQLKDESSEAEIKSLLKEICGEFSGEKKITCDKMVDDYSGDLINFLTANLSPDSICRKIRFCNAGKVVLRPENEPKMIKSKKSNVSCHLCSTLINWVLDNLHDNKTETEIKVYLDKVCDYMPEEIRDTCDNFINDYADLVVDMIIADFNATEICIHLHLCKPKTFPVSAEKNSLPFIQGFSVATNEIWKRKNSLGACHFCQLMERSMAIKGYEEKGAEGMLALLADVCMMDVENLYSDCARKLSEEIIPYGKDALLEMSDVCSKMKICPAEPSNRKSDSSDGIFGRIREAVEECAMCETVVGIVSRHLKMHATEYDFAGNASELCQAVPWDKIEMCKSMLTSYAPSVVHLLEKMSVEPNQVCFRLKLCDRNDRTKVDMAVTSLEQSGSKHLLGESEGCLNGPAFWCANLENAKKCRTLSHCREMVWKSETP